MFIHFYTYDVLIYIFNYDKNSLIIKVHVNVFCTYEWFIGTSVAVLLAEVLPRFQLIFPSKTRFFGIYLNY